MKLTFTRNCAEEPVFVPAQANLDICGIITKSGEFFPAQATDGGFVVITTQSEGETIEFDPVYAPDARKQAADGVKLEPGENQVEVYQGGAFFTAYRFDPAIAKPFLGPVCAPDGTPLTRLDLTAEEHPHQRSVICAVGDVNGVDFWNEYGNFGYERHQKLTEMTCGAAFARIGAENLWVDQRNSPLLREERKFTFYNQLGPCRYIDFETEFFADFGRVEFGPTKEAGPLGVRVADFMRPDAGARMTNSYGARGEAECWSHSANYCAYEADKSGKTYGVAVFDCESNERYPTTWHVRDYGLFAANNLYFRGGLTIPEGQSLRYRYRLCFYEGREDLQNRFNLYMAWQKGLAR